MNKDERNLKIEALYLVGHSYWDIAKAISHGVVDKKGRPKAYSAVNGLGDRRRLPDLRKSDQRPQRLVEIALASQSLNLFVVQIIGDAVRAIDVALKRGEVPVPEQAEALNRRRLQRDFDELIEAPSRTTKPEKVHDLRHRRVSVRTLDGMETADVYENANDCILSWMGAQGWLDPVSVSAGIAYRNDFHQLGGTSGAMDYGKIRVDGSGPDGHSLGWLSAIDRRTRADAAIRQIFRQDAEARLRFLHHIAVLGLHFREYLDMPRHLARRPSAKLRDTLEPVAWAYGLLHDGAVAKSLRAWTDSERAAKQAGTADRCVSERHVPHETPHAAE